jgi:pimeloyl-ACP methyl ester carboxylesterase
MTKETCCRFGKQGQLAGIITHPAGPARRVGCVLVNAGLVPKQGPYRLYTELARHLAGDGFVTLRFDLGGIGDSRQDYPSEPLKVRTDLEIGDAVDYLTKQHELDGLVLGGLCSGAEDAFRYAERDPRVTGIVLIDPFSYRTAGWKWRDLVHRVRRRSLRALGVYQPFTYHVDAGQGGAPTGKTFVDYKYIAHAESSRVLKAMIDRRVRVHFVYTGGVRRTFNHPGQLATMFKGIDFKGLVTLDYFPHTEHTQVLEEDRRQLVAAIGRRLVATAAT